VKPEDSYENLVNMPETYSGNTSKVQIEDGTLKTVLVLTMGKDLCLVNR